MRSRAQTTDFMTRLYALNEAYSHAKLNHQNQALVPTER